MTLQPNGSDKRFSLKNMGFHDNPQATIKSVKDLLYKRALQILAKIWATDVRNRHRSETSTGKPNGKFWLKHALLKIYKISLGCGSGAIERQGPEG